MLELPAALAAFAAYPQFILYRLVPSTRRPGKTDKFPVDPSTGAVSDAHNPAIWLSAEAAVQAAATPGVDGVGFVFTEADPFFFFDIDDCLEESGQWSDWANYLCSTFSGAAVEISQSGRGLHIFGSGRAPLGHACKAKDDQGRPLPFDLYTVGRFAALTGTGATGDAATDHTPALEQIAAAYLAPGPTTEATDWTDGPIEGYGGPDDDDELVARMLRSRSVSSVMGGKASLADLWGADEDVLGKCFPHDQGLEAFDHSGADMALCTHLAFWTGKDCERMDRLFRRSALCRDKWLDREHNYRVPTILKAVALCSDVYNPAPRDDTPTGEAPVSVDPGAAVPGEIRAGFQYLGVTQQQEHFTERDLRGVCFLPRRYQR
jgi:primase-polymerase (primpol)-like protein